MTSPTSSDDRTPAQGQGVGPSVQQDTRDSLDEDLDGLIAAAEQGVSAVPAGRVAGYLARILEDLPRRGLPVQGVVATLGRFYQAFIGGAHDDASAALPDAARELAALADRAPEGLAGRLRRLGELLGGQAPPGAGA